MSETENLRTQILAQNPTKQQRNAIFTDELEFLLRASPGSGKTWTSCRRFIWRGGNWCHKIGGLALLSFTNAAIREFYEATINVGRRDLLSDPNFIGTFDSFIERFLISPFGHLLTNSNKRPRLFLEPRPGDRNNQKLLGWMEINTKKRPVPAWEIIPIPYEGKVAFRTSNRFGGRILNFRWNNPVAEFFKLGFYSHAQRVYMAYRILNSRPYIAECLARRFPEIIVDEAQDTNVWLLILLNCLREKGSKVTLVGDPDQCIYEFSMADATSLPAFQEKWKISEMPLSQSFRCNNAIASSVRHISGNHDFEGCSEPRNEQSKAYIVRDSTSDFRSSIDLFVRHLETAGIPQGASAILCRAHHQLEAIRGDVNYNSLKGLTKEMALAAFLRDVRKDYKKAIQIVESGIRKMVDEPDFWDRLDTGARGGRLLQFPAEALEIHKISRLASGSRRERSELDYKVEG